MRRAIARSAAIISLVAALGCSRERPAPSASKAPTPALELAPVEMTVRQRTTTPVPGSDGSLLLTIDDITRDQVIASLAPNAGGVLLAPTSMAEGAKATFQLDGTAYVLTLKSLQNHLIGQDFATFGIFPAGPATLSEDEKIERLLEIIAGLQDATFIRNGAEHTSKVAANHLKTKWQSKAGQIKNATQFIDLVASQSSASGEAYQIRMADGRVVYAGDYLRERLAELERVER
jgi:hypothetical protein